ncbi:MAG: hypothetical protein AAFO69_02970, partial [Bacteroidota bacterium]
FEAYCPIDCEECVLGFHGSNRGTDCPDQQYRYEVYDHNGHLLHTYLGADMVYDFPGDGSYKVCMSIWVEENGKVRCEEQYCETVEFSKCPKKCEVKAAFDQKLAIITDRNRSFTDQSVSSANIMEWSWNFGDPGSGSDNYSTLQHPSHRFGIGSYEVCLIVTSKLKDGTICKDTYCETVRVVSEDGPVKSGGIANELLQNQTTLQVSPVPGNGRMQLRINSNQEGPARVRLMNLAGIVLYELEAPKVLKGENRLRWDLAGKLKNGTYLITVQLADQVLSHPILIRQ